MARRKRQDNIKKLSLLECFNSINEVFDRMIPTDYKIIDYGDYIAAQFKTNSGVSYDLEFHYTTEHSGTELDNGKTLGETLNTTENPVNGLDIAFTLSDINDKNDPEQFEAATNIKEQYEVMGRIAFIANKLYANNKKYNFFVIGNSKRNKPEIYEKLYKNLFSDMFSIYRGVSDHHYGESMFLIRK